METKGERDRVWVLARGVGDSPASGFHRDGVDDCEAMPGEAYAHTKKLAVKVAHRRGQSRVSPPRAAAGHRVSKVSRGRRGSGAGSVRGNLGKVRVCGAGGSRIAHLCRRRSALRRAGGRAGGRAGTLRRHEGKHPRALGSLRWALLREV